MTNITWEEAEHTAMDHPLWRLVPTVPAGTGGTVVHCISTVLPSGGCT